MRADLATLVVETDTRSAEEGARDLNRMDRAAENVERSVNRLGNTSQRTGARVGGLSRMTGIFSRNSRALRGNIQNTSYQLQDMMVQAEMGTDTLRIMSQQVPQILSGFGMIGGGLGLVAAVGFSVASMMKETSASAEDMEKNIGDLTGTLDELGDMMDKIRDKSIDLSKSGSVFDAISSRMSDRTFERMRTNAEEQFQKAMREMAESSALVTPGGDGDRLAGYKDFFDKFSLGSFDKELRYFGKHAQSVAAQTRNAVATITDGVVDSKDLDAVRTFLNLMEQEIGTYADMNEEQRSVYNTLLDMIGPMEEIVELNKQWAELTQQRSLSMKSAAIQAMNPTNGPSKHSLLMDSLSSGKGTGGVDMGSVDADAFAIGSLSQQFSISADAAEELVAQSKFAAKNLDEATIAAMNLAGVDFASPVSAAVIETAAFIDDLDDVTKMMVQHAGLDWSYPIRKAQEDTISFIDSLSEVTRMMLYANGFDIATPMTAGEMAAAKFYDSLSESAQAVVDISNAGIVPMFTDAEQKAISLFDSLSSSEQSILVMAGTDVASGISAAAAEAARLADHLGIALANAMAIVSFSKTAMMTAEDAAMSQPLDGSGEAAYKTGVYILNDKFKGMMKEKNKAARKGGGKSDRDPMENILREISQRERLLDVFGEERIVLESVFDIERRLGDKRSEYSDQRINEIAQQIVALEQLEEADKQALDRTQDLSDTMESAFSDSIMSMVDGTKDFGEAVGDMARTVIAKLFEILVVQQLVGSFNAQKGTGSGIVGMLMGALTSADGNVFDKGKVVKHAKGGVVDNLTFFPMSDGGVGSMAEEGPEAIMPLSRGSDGKLGVKAQGGSPNVTQNFYISANGDQEILKVVQKSAPQFAQAAMNEMMDERSRGGPLKEVFR